MTTRELGIQYALAAAGASTCPKANVGAVIVDTHGRHFTGWNGAPLGWPTCRDVGCRDDGESHGPTHIHAEVRAILHAGKRANGAMLYTSQRPCHRCISIANLAGIFQIEYPGGTIRFTNEGYEAVDA